MSIAILSDSHDNLLNLNKTLQWINQQKINTIIHCGDICSAATLKAILDNFAGEIHYVAGNADQVASLKQLAAEEPRLTFYGKEGQLTVDDKKISFTHFPDRAKELARRGDNDLVFYGHSHKPWAEKINGRQMVNPGNVAGMFYKATFAVYYPSRDKLELKILERL